MVLNVVFSEITEELQVDFEDNDFFLDLGFDETETDIELDFGEISEVLGGEISTYDGPYNVRPALVGKKLETEGLVMREDVTVEQIPIYIVSNNSGGNTVVIGG